MGHKFKLGTRIHAPCIVPLVIESDSLSVVHMVKSYEECLAAEGAFVEGERRLLANHESSAVRHIPRHANRAAHHVAHFSLRDQGVSRLMDEKYKFEEEKAYFQEVDAFELLEEREEVVGG
ncbi:hypothetical protein L3X38_024612 [Prunus dulcis]|uniref:RNase H type-1 domain-containing protein n=1 Tax=Prunus dulcis TaxID=3755 RepID=A0AAD4Z6N7_PRUDU|nr:hypothetical protein L3X38_024612 [Prunus dulcis]